MECLYDGLQLWPTRLVRAGLKAQDSKQKVASYFFLHAWTELVYQLGVRRGLDNASIGVT